VHAVVIRQDPVDDHGCPAGDASVRRERGDQSAAARAIITTASGGDDPLGRDVVNR